jgi:hypothetical protein
MCSKRVASGEAQAAQSARGHARRSAAPALAGLVAVLGLYTLAGCDEFEGRDYGRSEGFRSGRRDGDGRGWRGHRRHRDRDGERPDAAAPFDAGSDAGALPDASVPGTAATAGASTSDAGAADAGAGGSVSVDAGAIDSAVLALSDGQIVAVADALLLAEADQARAAEPLLVDADVIAFAEQMVAQREAARTTLASLAAAIDLGAEPSVLADEVLADSARSLEQLSLDPDAGAIDADFLSSREAVHASALERFGALAAAADAPALRAQLVVFVALEQSALDRTRDLSASR